MNKDTVINIRISKDDKEIIRNIAQKECRGISSMIRYLIHRAANSYEFPFEKEYSLGGNKKDNKHEIPI